MGRDTYVPYDDDDHLAEQMKTATEISKEESRHQLRYALEHLLHGLRDWVRVYPFNVDDALPEHDVVWVSGVVEGGPEATILEAIKMHPELWEDAIPPEVCIVRREALEALLSKDVVAALAIHGQAAVDHQAHKVRMEHERALHESRTTPRVR